MRNSQKEIAAPRTCCNKYWTVAAIATTTSSLTIIATLLMFIVEFIVSRQVSTSKLALSIGIIAFFVLLLSLTIRVLIKTKAKDLIKIISLFALLALAAMLIIRLTIAYDKILVSKFSLSMLFLVLILTVFIALGIYFMVKYRDRVRIFTLLCSILFSSTVIFAPFSLDDFVYTLGNAMFSSLAQVLLFVIISFSMMERKIITTKWLTYCASFAALSVVFKIMGNAVSFIPFLRFTLTYIPWVVSGIVLGPIGGMIAAGVGDVLGQLIMPAGIGALNPFLTLSSMLFPVFPALFYKYAPMSKKWLSLMIGMLISTVVCTLGISTLTLWYYYFQYMSFGEYFVLRLNQVFIITINYVLILLIVPALERTKTINLQFINKDKIKAVK